MSLVLELQLTGLQALGNLEREVREKFRREVRARLVKAADLLMDAEREHSISTRVDRALSRSIQVTTPDDFQVTVGVDRRKAFFAHFLEGGTVHARAFPFREPSLEQTEEAIFDLIGLAFLPK